MGQPCKRKCNLVERRREPAPTKRQPGRMWVHRQCTVCGFFRDRYELPDRLLAKDAESLVRAWSAEDIADRISLKAHTFIVE